MNYKLNADTVRGALRDFIAPEADLLWHKRIDVYVGHRVDHHTGEDTFHVSVNDESEGLRPNADFSTINSITLDLYRPTPHVKSQLSEFAITVKNQLKLML